MQIGRKLDQIMQTRLSYREDEHSGQHAEIIEADLTQNIILHLIVQYRMSQCLSNKVYSKD